MGMHAWGELDVTYPVHPKTIFIGMGECIIYVGRMLNVVQKLLQDVIWII